MACILDQLALGTEAMKMSPTPVPSHGFAFNPEAIY
jgi:hypothetical protein